MMVSRRGALGLAAASAALFTPFVARAAAPAKLSLALVPLASSGAVLIAQGRGWFQEAGVDVTFKTFNAAGPVPVAVVSGDADLGVTAMTAGFYNMAGQGAIKLIAGQSREVPGFELNGFVVSNAAWDAGVRRFEDLVGRRVAITTTGSSVHYSLLLAAKKKSVDPAKINLVALQSIANMSAAFKGGQVDAMVSPVNTFRQLASEGFGKLIAWTGDIAPWQLGGVFASPKVIAEKQEALGKFMLAYRRGCQAYHTAFNQRDAAGKAVKGEDYETQLALISKMIGQSPELVKDGLPYIDAKGELDLGDIAQQVTIWKEAKMIAPTVSADSVIDSSFR